MQIIETPRLIFRSYTQNDISSIHEILSDKKTMAFWPEPFTIEQTRRWIERSKLSFETNGFGRFAVVLRESGKLIGDCGIMLSETDGVMENDLGYIIHSRYHRNGYGTEAAKVCLNYAFGKLRLTRLTANMEVNHTASVRVAEKIGMKKEKEFINKRNRNLLTCLYSLTV